MGYNENVATSDSYAANCILGLYPGAYPGGVLRVLKHPP